MPFSEIKKLVGLELQQVNELIAKQFGSDVTLIKKLSDHIFNSGGKRIRPILVLLTGKLFNFHHEHLISLATIIELIHTATLLHDDVVDNSSKRRGKDSAFALWGSEASILVGDFIYSRSFQLMTQLKNLEVLEILANASNRIAEGEVMQLTNIGNLELNEKKYLETIDRKTATLFSAATATATLLAGHDQTMVENMQSFGYHLGMAFQIMDDLLDYGFSSADTGKNIGTDLIEGKLTLPLIDLFQHGTADDKNLITDAIHRAVNQQISERDVQKIIGRIQSSDSIPRILAKANEHSELALSFLQDTPVNTFQHALKELTYFVIERTH